MVNDEQNRFFSSLFAHHLYVTGNDRRIKVIPPAGSWQEDITGQVSWTSSNELVATITLLPGSS